jgi:hypothetical protein
LNAKYALTALVCLVCLLAVNTYAMTGEEDPSGREKGPVLKFTIPEHDLFPENIAYDPVSGDYFLGSLSQRKILRIKEDGSYTDFVFRPEGAMLLSSVGMKVDAKRRILWVCSGRYTLLADYDMAPAKTGVLKFNIDEGTLVGEWMLDQETDYHIFNDLAMAANGDVYATTTMMGRVYRMPAEGKDMELVLQLDEGSHNNGIALSDDDKYLFMTVDRTIHRLDLGTGELVKLEIPEADALGTDGLYYYKNSLVSQKPRFNRITQIFLNDDATGSSRVDTLAEGHEALAYPTTGVVVGDKLVFVATSYANMPRNAETAKQHGDVLIYEVGLRTP